MQSDETSREPEGTAALLQAYRQEILRVWEDRVRRALPHAARQPSLLDAELPTFLDQLSRMLSTGPVPQVVVAPAPHSCQTRETDSLVQTILEYRLLRQTVFDVLEARGPVNGTERRLILEAIEAEIQDAAAEFARQQSRAHYWTIEQYRLLVNNARDVAIILLDTEGHIVGWNPGAEYVTGYGIEEVIGEHFGCLFTPQDCANDQPQKELEDAAKGGRAEIDRWQVRRDGTTFWGSGVTSCLRDDEGTLCGYSRLLRDDTERRRLELEVKQRTEELAQAHRRKDEFLAMLAHELRNPLAPIINSIHSMRQREMNDPMLVRARDVIERQVDQIARLLDDLLNVTRIVHGKIQLQREMLDLTTLVRDTVEDYRQTMQERQLNLIVDVPEEPVVVCGDQTRLKQVLSNLLTNSGKFTDPGGEMRVCLAVVGEAAELSVQDNGIGIPPEQLPAVFDTFMQVDQGLAHSLGGLGLGLALVRGLAEMHGGSVRAESEGTGKGARFTVTLPLAREERPYPMQELDADSGGPLRVILIDDNQDAAESLKDVLELSGHKVAVALSAADGIALTLLHLPDVVICDIGLPGMDGYAVSRELKSNPATSSISLIAISGYGLDEDRRKSEGAGFLIHLTKPIDPRGLRILMAGLCHERAARSNPASSDEESQK